jgi:predicted nucleic acid-binding protein
MTIELVDNLTRPKITRRYAITWDTPKATAALLRRDGVQVDVQDRDIFAVTGDPEDDLVLATARLGNAEYLVTRDKRLLGLDTYAGTSIVEPHTFLSILRQQS